MRNHRRLVPLSIIRAFFGARSGNITITFAFSAIPVLFALGAAADYGYAVKTRARMNAAADAAALAAVTPYMMTQKTNTAKKTAQNMFNAQVGSLPRINFNSNSDLKVKVSDATVNNQRVRTATVSYSADSVTAFTNIIRMPTIAIAGTSTASAGTSPNIDFYLMLDTSPSMAIPATQAGIDWMVAATPYQDGGTKTKPIGCAFACHEAQPYNESMGTPAAPKFGNQGCADDPLKRAGPCLDNYTLARNATLSDGSKIVLRMDLVTQAVVNLILTAQSTSQTTGAAYRLAGYTFDRTTALPMPLQAPTAAAQVQAAAIQMMTVPYENTYFDATGKVVANNDMDTDFDVAFARLSTDMTAAGAGTGSNTKGDKPQQVLMLVTDGVSDESYKGGARIYTPLGGTTNLGADMTQACTDAKSDPNVRIAVLYLTYNRMPMTNGTGGQTWYAGNVAPLDNDINPTLKNCASPGLFYQVNTGGDVSAAMNALFKSAIQSAKLTN